MLASTMQQLVNTHAVNAVATKHSALRFYVVATSCDVEQLNKALAKYKFHATCLYSNAPCLYSNSYVVTHAACEKLECDDCTVCNNVKCYNNLR